MADSSSSSSSALIFLGTGCSSGVPSPKCLISDLPCRVCSQSLSLSPESNPNHRCNTSLLIDYSETCGEHKYILIDAGKTFREQLLRWFIHHKIPQVDSVILTHEHADAVLGLDHLRAVQPLCGQTGHLLHIPVYLNQDTMSSLAQKLSYLVQKPLEGGQQEESELLPEFDWRIIESDCQTSFVASGLRFIPLPVMHGEDYVSLGFLFGKKHIVAYISDVSRFPAATEYAISRDGAGQVDFLILDSNTTRESLEVVRRIAPKRALLVGMNHDFDHISSNMHLQNWSRREGIPVQLAHDGLKIPLEL